MRYKVKSHQLDRQISPLDRGNNRDQEMDMRVEQSSAASINNRVERVASHWKGICFSLMLAVSAVVSLSAPQLGQTQIPPDGTAEDWDGDGVPDVTDLDDDNDGIIDSLEEVKTCDSDDLNGEIDYKYEQLPVLPYHRRLPISSDGTFTTVDEFGVPKLGNPTTDSSYTYNSNGSLVAPGNASGTETTNKLDLMRFDSKVFFPGVDPGTKIQIRLTASGPEDQSWWVISEDESLENWIDPVSDDHGPLLDMGGTVDYVPVSTNDHNGVDLTTRPLGVNLSGGAQYRNRGFSEDFVAEITVSEAGHAFAIGIRDPQVSWGKHDFEYSPDGGQTWETADDFGTNDPCSFSLDNDYDRDGIVNSLDLDSDNDGISDLIEAGGVAASDIEALATSYPNGYYPTSTVGTNGVTSEVNNGAGYARGTGTDLDADDDGIPDAIEAQSTSAYISISESDAASSDAGIDKLYNPQDTDNDGTPDFLDTDSDDDGKSDSDEKGNTVNTDSSGPVTYTATDGGYTPATDLENEVGNTNEVAYREVPPEVSISNIGTVSEAVTITGTCEPNSATVTVSIEGVSPDQTATCTDGSYSAGAFDISELADGSVAVTSMVRDSNGNTASTSQELLVDNPTTDTELPSAQTQSYSNELSGDWDGDGISNRDDLDDDNDGILDSVECAQITKTVEWPLAGFTDAGVTSASGQTVNLGDVFSESSFDDLLLTVKFTENSSGYANNKVGTNVWFGIAETPGNPAQILEVSLNREVQAFQAVVGGELIDGKHVKFTSPGVLTAPTVALNDGVVTANRVSNPVGGSGTVNYSAFRWDSSDYRTITISRRQDVNGLTSTSNTGHLIKITVEGNCDTDGDGKVDIRDLDSDNDGVSDLYESYGSNTTTGKEVDVNNDGIYDDQTLSSSNSGVVAFANDGNGIIPADDDADGITNQKDLDSDGDGIPDAIEIQPTTGYKSIDETVALNDEAGVVTLYIAVDSDTDGTPDYLDLDSDDDGKSDDAETLNTIIFSYAKTDGGVSPTELSNESGDTSEVAYREQAVTENTTVVTFDDDEACSTGTDHDGDGVSDICDLDDDNDGVPDIEEKRSDVEITMKGDCTGSTAIWAYGVKEHCSGWKGDFLLGVNGTTTYQTNFDVISYDSNTDVMRVDLQGSPLYWLVGKIYRDFPSESGHTYRFSGTRETDLTTFCGDRTPYLRAVDVATETVLAEKSMLGSGAIDLTYTAIGSETRVTIGFDRGCNGGSNRFMQLEKVIDTGTGNNAVSVGEDTDGDGILDHLDLDSDNDGISDLVEAGGVAASDIEALSTSYPNGYYPTSTVGTNGVTSEANDGAGYARGTGTDLDADDDGIPDAIEAQPTTGYVSVDESAAANSAVGTDKLYTPQDTDNDGTPDFLDTNSDNDKLSDDVETSNEIDFTYTTTDGGVDPTTLTNGIGDTSEVAYREDLDSDGDGVPDSADECSTGADSDDHDNDNVPDTCDLDDDNDGILDAIESPTCYFTREEILNITSVTSELSSLTAVALATTIDGNSLTHALGARGEAMTGVVLYALELDRAVPLQSIDVESRYTIGTNTSVIKWQGGDGLSWQDITDDITTTQAENSTQSYAFTKNLGDYSHYRMVGVSGATYWNRVEEFIPVVSDDFNSSAYPKASCSNDADADGDGVLDHHDLDSDNDGISDLVEAGGLAATDIAAFGAAYPGGLYPTNTVSTNGVTSEANDGAGYARGTGTDLDADNDGIPDAIEAQSTSAYISISETDAASSDAGIDKLYNPQDTDNDGTPDFLDEDSDDDGKSDSDEKGNTVNTDSSGPVTYTATDGGYTPATDLENEVGNTNEVAYREVPPEVSISNTGTVSEAVTITGTCEPNSATVTVSIDGVSPDQIATCIDGSYSAGVFDISKLPNGSVTVTSTIEVSSGNTVATTATLDIDNPMTVTITGPTEGEELTGPTETITGVCSPVGGTVSVTLDPSGATPSPATTICSEDGTYTVDVNTSKMPDGSATITSEIEDADGNMLTTTVTVEIDNPLSVTITGPSEGEALSGPTETVTGSCSPVGSTVSVSVSPAGATPAPAVTTCGPDGTFTVDINTSQVPDGSATITTDIEDADGNKETASITVDIDNPVTVTITGPSEGEALSGPTETVTGSCSPIGGTVSVTLSPAGASPAPATTICDADGNYSVEVDISKMPEGNATITSEVEDADGNTESTAVEVEIDNPLSVTITGPSEGEALSGPTETVTGSCSPVGSTVSVSVSPAGATPAPAVTTCGPDGTFTVDINTSQVPDGSATITTDIEDADGNKETASITVDIDNPVTVTITGPSEGDALSGPTETVTGSCSPIGGTVSVTLSPAGASPAPATTICDADGNYSVEVDISKMPEGNATITSEVEDADGNTESTAVEVEIDNPLSVTITGPSEGEALSGPTETVTGSCSPVGSTVSVSVSPAGATPAPAVTTCGPDGTFTVDINTSQVPDGSATITTDIEDADGNKETASITVDIDNPVTVTITGPSEGDALSGPTETVTGSCSPIGGTVSVTLSPAGATPAPATTICDADGNYSVEVDISKMPEGAATITSEVEDADGNTESTAVEVDIDNPLSVTITGPSEGEALSGPTETVTGSCSPVGSTVSVSVSPAGATPNPAVTTCGPDGSYTVDINTSQVPDGSATITTDIEDADGNKETANISVDIDNPVTVTITGPSEGDALSGPTETVTGSCSPIGGTVSVTLSPAGASPAPATTICDADGNYSVEVDISKMPEGNATITSEVEDADGNTESTAVEVEIDNPLSVTITGPSEGDALSGPTETVTGSCSPVGSTVSVSVSPAGASPAPATTICDADGNYSVEVDISKMPEGNATITSEVEDADGNTESAAVEVEIDNPLSVTITGPSEGDALSGPTETVTGSCSPVGSTVSVSVSPAGATPAPAVTTCGPDGTFTVDINTSQVPDGSATITTDIEDADGNKETASISVEIDNPVTVTITGPSEGEALSGPTETVTGSCSPIGGTVSVTLSPAGASPAPATTICDADGNYSVEVDISKMPEGNATITSEVEDADGNTESTAVEVEIDNPLSVTITGPSEGEALSGPTETVTGSCSPVGSTVSVSVSPAGATPAPAVTTCGPDGTFTVDINTSQVPDGSATITTDIEDADGNKETASITVDIDNPVTVTITGPSEGEALSGPTETVTGSCSPIGGTVSVTLSPAGASPAPATTICDADGNYSVEVDISKMPEGNATITSEVEDADGNTESTAVEVEIDNPLSVTITGPSEGEALSGPTETVTGSCSPVGSTVSVSVSPAGATPAPAVTTCGPDGSYTVDINTSQVPDGSATITTDIEDADGNKETASISVEIDNPVTVTITGPSEGDALSGPTETVTGSCSPIGGTVSVTLSPAGASPAPATTICDADGNYSVEVDISKMPEGNATITSEVEDADGNTESTAVEVEIDNPLSVTITGPSEGEALSGPTETVTGSCSPVGSTVSVSVSPAGASPAPAVTTCGPDGTFTVDINTSQVPDGSATITTDIEDADGNKETASISVDIDNPVTVTITGPSEGDALSGPTETVTGSCSPIGGTVSVTLSPAGASPAPATTICDADGNYSVEVDISKMPEGNATITSEVEDADGNTESAAVEVEIDNPLSVTITGPSEGEALSGPTETVTGSCSPVGSTVSVSVSPAGATPAPAVTTCGPDGSYTVDINTSQVPDGSATITTDIEDADGNKETASISVEIDNPVTVTITGPSEGDALSGPTETVTGSCSPIGGTVSVTLSPAGASPAPATTICDADGNYSVEVDISKMPEGNATITSEVEDADGNTESTAVEVEIDNPLSVTITGPSEGEALSGPTETVTGSCSPVGSTVSVSVSPAGASPAPAVTTCGPDGTFTVDINTSQVPDGSATITTDIEDADGNKETASISVDIDNPVTVTITGPSEGDALSGPTETVTGSCSPIGGTVSVTLSPAGASPAPATTICDADGNYSVEVDISKMPEGNATITSEVEDADGNTESTAVEVEIDNPLSVTITGPSEGEALSGPTETVTGSCSPVGGTVSVTLSPAGASPAPATTICDADGNYSVEVDISKMPEGNATITSEVEDADGNTESTAVEVEIDNPLSVTITGPSEGEALSGPTETVTGSCSPVGSTVSVSVSPAGASPAPAVTTCGPDGTFTVDINTSQVPDGSATITTDIEDADGNKETASISVDIDNPVTVTITGPSEGEALSGPTETVTGSCSPVGSTVSVSVSPAGATPAPATTICDADGNYSVEVDISKMPEGNATITSEVEDADGNTESAAVEVEIDNPLSVTITGPSEGEALSGPTETVTGSCSPVGSTVSVSVSPAGATPAPAVTTCGPDGSYTVDINTSQVPDGSATITTDIEDADGNKETASITVDIDNPVTVTITGPSEGEALSGPTETVTGSCSPIGGTVSVTLSPAGASPAPAITICDADGNYSVEVDISKMPEGNATITSEVEDADGNTESTAVEVEIDNPLSVTITGPSEGEALSGPTETVTGSCSPIGGTVSVTLSPAGASPAPATTICDADGNYSVEVDISKMPEGNATITSEVEDADGNTESAAVEVEIDNPLSVSITGPSEGSELTGGTDTVTGTCAPPGSTVSVSIGSDAESATGSSICSESGTYVVTIDTSELTSGTKTITSEVCLSSGDCESAEVGVILIAKDASENSGTVTINAENDVVNLAAMDGVNGKPSMINVLDNDSYDGHEASVTDVEIKQSSITMTNAAGESVDGLFSLDANGNLSIESETPAGTYMIAYWICDNTNPTNCDRATITVVVPMPPIVAEDESGISFTDKTGTTQVNLLSNDTFDGEPVSNDYIQIEMDKVTAKDADGNVVTDSIKVDSEGNVSLMEGVTPGLYYVEYMICDKVNTTNCDTATLSIVVQQKAEPSEVADDSDTVDTAVEDKSPNNGDSNNDGIADSTQSMVTALLDCPPDADNCDVNVSNDPKRDWVTLSIIGSNGESLNDKCQEIVNPYSTQENVNNAPGPNDIAGINAQGTGRWTISDDPDYVYPLGLVGFAIECTEPNQEVAGIKSYFYGHQTLLDEGVVSGAGDYFIRKYADPTGSGDDDSIDDATYNFMSDLVNVEVTEENSPCNCDSNGDGTMDKVLVLTYTLKDDARGDSQKGQTSTGQYRIFDPHGPALSDVNFSLSKRVNKKQAAVGDVVSYTLVLENLSRSPAKILVHDKPSAGLSIKQDTIKLSKDSITPKVTILADGTLEITDNGELITVEGKERITISYLAQVSPGAVAGEISNTASVKASRNGKDLSNAGVAKLNVGSDPIFDLATIIGKVYNDSNKNEQQDQGEQGLAGVRLATVSGMIIITDKHGRYHIPGVESDIGGRGKNFILKLDDHSISSCAKVISENPRVVRLTSGLMSKIDFRVDLGEAGYTAPKEEVKLLDTIYFANANDDISDDQIRRLDEQLRPYLHMKGVKVRVSGHTDSDKLKSASYLKKYGDNYGLSHYRAQTVGAQLQSRLNIPDSRIEYAAYGPDKPIASNDTEAGQAKNRRVEVQVVTLTEQKAKSSAKCDTKGATQKISRTDGAKTVKQIRAVLSDDFYDIGSVAPKNPAKLDRLLNILNKRGGTVVVKSEIEALAKARRMALESLVTDKVTVTNE